MCSCRDRTAQQLFVVAAAVQRLASCLDVSLGSMCSAGSVLLKHESPYYEWFYADIEPMIHYIPFKSDLSDLLDRLNWAEAHPEEAQAIADRGMGYFYAPLSVPARS